MLKNQIDEICECTKCERGSSCYMYEKYQRLPRPDGLGLCPKLITRKPKNKSGHIAAG